MYKSEEVDICIKSIFNKKKKKSVQLLISSDCIYSVKRLLLAHDQLNIECVSLQVHMCMYQSLDFACVIQTFCFLSLNIFARVKKCSMRNMM